MCYDEDAAPPAYGPPITAVESSSVTLTSTDGATFSAFEALPSRPSGPGVVVLPDVRGLHTFYKRLAVRLAEQGHPAIAIDYYGRTAADDDRGADFPIMEHVVKLSREATQGDIRAASAHLGGSAVALGFCMGGRNAFLASAASFGFAGVIGFYGAPGIAGPYGPGPTQHAGELSAPILGLFGGADEGIPASEVTLFGRALTEAGVEHDLVTYPGAPHGFFDGERDGHAEACADAWRRVMGFLASR